MATKTTWADDRLTGTISGENCRGTVKLQQLADALPQLKERYQVIAYSDHHVDLPLLRWADQAVAVNPTKQLKTCALREGISIVDWNSRL